MKYTNTEDYLGKIVVVTIDRQLHSKHPEHNWEYQLNYGFIPGTESPDGEELDVYVIGIDTPIKEFKGRCVAIIRRSNDSDDKLIVTTSEYETISDEEIRAKTYFQEQWFLSKILR